ncbi:biosynthetic-type acetolactate synthase large subunit [Dethiosulfovibrio salsuginis]|uniref:Acetolactate synthase n=1 Tax=Dethiosulfovibrio salsuginis TaxID=561720 RepID=A0A1X7JSW9_9BACT|nr:biosynthetic-type acetolactate synthase large subunit [Dethiosulfovibrio salsuginis]SMG31496.1 acetolactate synthase, large subunit [Dethiosulfovibrio salsuginis]
MADGMTGADIIVKVLEGSGTDVVFGIPGGTVIPLYDSLYGSSLRHVLARHEQGACFEAAGYARASGKVGVCLATSGPGALNTLTALADSYADSVSLVVITGQVGANLRGTDAFQEADLFGSSLSMVKHSFSVESADDLEAVMGSAFTIASSGRPGPVLVDVPVSVQRQVAEDPRRGGVPLRTGDVVSNSREILSILPYLRKALKPVILAGGGVIASDASEELSKLARACSIPVATSLMGKGGFPEGDPLSLGMAGMHGTERANRALSDADLIVSLGCRFSDRTTAKASGFGKGAAIVQVDIDAAEVGKIIPVDLGVVSDIRQALEALNRSGELTSLGRDRGIPRGTFEEDHGFSPKAIMETIRDRLRADDVITTEVGQHQMWAALHWRSDLPRTFITSGGQGTMGFGLPAAIGASMARPGRPVVCLAGDGSFLMNSQEMETAVRYGLPVKVVVFNNRSLGMVRQWQELFWNRRYSATVEAPSCDFAALARAYGAEGINVSSMKELESAIDDFLSSPGPSLMECPIEQEEKVFPMVPAGADLGDFIVEPPK